METRIRKSIKQVAHRMAKLLERLGPGYGYFATPKDADIFYDEIVYTIVGQLAAPNSPQWFNTGLHTSYDITASAGPLFCLTPLLKS